MSALSKYEEAIKNPAKRGAGLHQHVMRVACLGKLAGLTTGTILTDCQTIPGLKAGEAQEAVERAFSIELPEQPRPVHSKFAPTFDKPLEKFIAGCEAEDMDLIEASPVRLLNDPETDGRLILETLYQPEEHLFIGGVYEKTVKPVKDWLCGSLAFPHIIPNPMSGEFGTTGNGKESRRCEETVSDMRYAVCEMDSIPLDQQVKFWFRCVEKKLPVAAVIHSGGKSLHGWMRVDCKQDAAKWETEVKGWLFGVFGVKYGFDLACSNKARLSRMPGFYREEKRNRQVLLYLNGAL